MQSTGLYPAMKNAKAFDFVGEVEEPTVQPDRLVRLCRLPFHDQPAADHLRFCHGRCSRSGCRRPGCQQGGEKKCGPGHKLPFHDQRAATKPFT